MIGWLAVAAASVLLVVPVAWCGARRRLARVGDSGPAPPREADGRRSRLLLAGVAAVAVAGLIGTWWGVPLGVAAGVGLHRFLGRREPARVRQERLAAAADLPLGADLLAAAVRAGAPVDCNI